MSDYMNTLHALYDSDSTLNDDKALGWAIDEITRLRAIIEQDNVEPVRIIRLSNTEQGWSQAFGSVRQATEDAIEIAYLPKDSTEPASNDWVMVPKIPTDEMYDAGQKKVSAGYSCMAIYEAMIAAAPTTPKGE